MDIRDKAEYARLEAEQERQAYSVKLSRDTLLPEPTRRPEYVSLLTHNGLFTVKSVRTGEHRTFRVRTQKSNAEFAPGKRIVSLLSGPDNCNNYTQFAFVSEVDGRPHVNVWSKKYSLKYCALAKMLENLDAHEKNGLVEVYVSTTCRVCNRTLTTPDSVRSGIGPICEGR